MSPGRHNALKLELTRAELERVRGHPALASLSAGEPVTHTQRSIYFDTPDHRLRSHGISLLLRTEGSGWKQAVAAHVAQGDGRSHAVEVQDAVEKAVPDPRAIGDRRIRRKVRKTIDRSVLEPVFESVVERTTCQLQSADGRLELALDQGLLRAGDDQNAICEAGLELKSGRAECLLQTAAQLFATAPLRIAGASTTERGYDMALAGKAKAPAAPQRADQPRIGPAQSCAEAYAAIVQSAVTQITANRCAVLETDDPDAAHQLRIGLRRLRSALRAFRPLADTPALRELDGRAQALARCAGELRDADVLIEEIYTPVAGVMQDTAALAGLRALLLAHRTQARKKVRAELCGERWSVLQLHFAVWPRTIEDADQLSLPVAKFARTALRKRWRKVADSGERLDELSVEDRHAMRKALKALRYTAEFFATLYSDASTRPFVREIRSLQEVFGYLTDVVAAEQLSAICREAGAATDVQQAAGFVLGWHNARAAQAWPDAHEGWRRLRKQPHFWA
jgi:triphosphatase